MKDPDRTDLALLEHFPLPERLREQAAVLELAPVLVRDLEGRILQWTLGAERLYGFSKQEAFGRLAHELFRTEFPESKAQVDEALRRTGKWEGELVRRKRDGQRLVVASQQIIYHDRTGRPARILEVSTDLTERKRAEDALRQSKQRFGAFMDNLPGFAWMKDVQGRYAYANKAVAQLPEVRGDWLGKTDAEFWPAEIAARCQANDQKVIATREALQTVEPFVAQGEQRHALVSKFPIFDATGNLVLVGGIGIDVTERQRAEEHLRESEARFRELADNIDEVFWLATADLQAIVYVSPAYERVWGRSCESLRQAPHSFLEAIDPQDRPRVLEALQTRTAAAGPAELEYRIIRPDGAVRWISHRSFPIRNEAGRIYRLGGTARDITGRKQIEEQLAIHQAQLEEAQALAQLGRWHWDIPTGALSWSDELYAMAGRDPQGFSPTYAGFFELLHPDDRAPFQAALEGALTGQRPYDCEVRVVQPDGSVRVLHARGQVIFDPGGKPLRMVGTAQDITETKQAQAALQRANEQLHLLSRRLFDVQEGERRHLARELHDQIGQALTAATINLQSARGLKARSALMRRLDEALAIVEGLLQQVRQLSLELRPPLLDDLGLVPALRWYLDQQAQRAGLCIGFFADPELGDVDAAIQTACFRVAQEALTNVVRHARAHTVSVELHRTPGALHLAVRDDGRGFDVAAALERAERGESLGLLGMRERVALVGGELDCRSEPDRGTEVHAFLPVAARADAQEPTL